MSAVVWNSLIRQAFTLTIRTQDRPWVRIVLTLGRDGVRWRDLWCSSIRTLRTGAKGESAPLCALTSPQLSLGHGGSTEGPWLSVWLRLPMAAGEDSRAGC